MYGVIYLFFSARERGGHRFGEKTATLDCGLFYIGIMAKKRKARGSAKQEPVRNEETRFDATETFADSADEFETGRDHILLEERPDVKRRRRLEEDGLYTFELFLES